MQMKADKGKKKGEKIKTK